MFFDPVKRRKVVQQLDYSDNNNDSDNENENRQMSYNTFEI